jgi:hypothetical protein
VIDTVGQTEQRGKKIRKIWQPSPGFKFRKGGGGRWSVDAICSEQNYRDRDKSIVEGEVVKCVCMGVSVFLFPSLAARLCENLYTGFRFT